MLAVSLHVRTRKAVEQAKVFPKRIAYEFISHRIETGGLRAPKGGFTEEMIDFDGVADLLIKTAIIPCWMEMQTLDCKLLETSEGGVFITSDNPVVILNQFAARLNVRRSFAGFSQTGFQLLLRSAQRSARFSRFKHLCSGQAGFPTPESGSGRHPSYQRPSGAVC